MVEHENLNSQKRSHSAPSWASYMISIVTILLKLTLYNWYSTVLIYTDLPCNKDLVRKKHRLYLTMWYPYVDGLVQDRCNSSAVVMELRLSCTNPTIFALTCNLFSLYCEEFGEIWSQILSVNCNIISIFCSFTIAGVALHGKICNKWS